jgi:hypothetical protein
LEHNDAKVITDEKILRAEAAQKYWKTHDFDHINCRFYEQEKEDAFLKRREEEMKVHGQN